MKLVIDIPEGTYESVRLGTINQVLEYKVWNAIQNGTPFDSVIEDIKAEITKHNIADFIAVQSVLEIIEKHISGKGNE